MDLKLTGKKALVTGASFGLGKAAALALAYEGCALYLNARSEENLARAASDIESKTGIKSITISADVSSQDGIDAIAKHIDDVDILVSNAGGPPPGQFLDHDDKKWDEAQDLVLFSARKLTSLVLHKMVEQKYGRLIYITSVGVLAPVNDLILSNSYRAAVTAMCKTISNNYAKFGITANCVCPGFTATERLSNLVASRAEQTGQSEAEIIDSFVGQIPVGRIGEPDELAALITFLSSEKASYITGTSIPVDGGFIKSLL